MDADHPVPILRRRSEIRAQVQMLSARIQEAAAQLSRLESEAAYLDGLLESGYQTESRPYVQAQSTAPRPDSHGQETTKRNPDRKLVAARALELISEARRPLSRKTLFKRLKEEGLEVYGKDPLMVLTTMLWREREQIIRIPGFGYWPVGKSYAPGHYFPDQTEQLGLTLPDPEGTQT